jgi:hypothetical protein
MPAHADVEDCALVENPEGTLRISGAFARGSGQLASRPSTLAAPVLSRRAPAYLHLFPLLHDGQIVQTSLLPGKFRRSEVGQRGLIWRGGSLQMRTTIVHWLANVAMHA